MNPAWPTNRSLRVGTRDREQVIALLGEHLAAGRLELAEFEDRVGRATAAKVVADLDRLLSDLPNLAVDEQAARDKRIQARMAAVGITLLLGTLVVGYAKEPAALVCLVIVVVVIVAAIVAVVKSS